MITLILFIEMRPFSTFSFTFFSLYFLSRCNKKNKVTLFLVQYVCVNLNENIDILMMCLFENEDENHICAVQCIYVSFMQIILFIHEHHG